jgi:hypothetical protein
MTPRGAFTAASLAANVLLAVLLLTHAPKSTPRPAVEMTAAAGASTAGQRFERSPEEVQGKAGPGEASFSWAQLESEDYQQYIARLRAFEVPERTIRDIILADVQKAYRPKLAAFRGQRQGRTNFWENRGFFGPTSGLTREQRQQLSALQKEERELVKSLLGKNVYQEIARDAGQPNWTERMLGPLPEGLRDQVIEIQERFQQANAEIHMKAEGYIDQDTQAELKVLRRKFRDELAGVLTPQQIREYELRNSDISNQMRWQLSAFEPNEKEFRAIFDYKQAMEDLQPASSEGSAGPSSDETRRQKQKELETALAEALGGDRSKELKMLENWEYRNLAEAGVPRETLLKIAEMKQQAESAAAEVRRDKTLSTEQRAEALQAVRAETEKSLAGLVGERRAKAYSGNGGYWLRNIAPKQ